MRIKLNLKLLQLGLILVSVPLVIQISFFAVLWHLLQEADYQTRRESHAKEVGLQLDEMMSLVVEGGRTVYIYKFLRDQKHKNEFAAVLEQIPLKLKILQDLTEGDAEERKAFERLNRVAQQALIYLEDVQRRVEDRAVIPLLAEKSFTTQAADCLRQLNECAATLRELEKQTEYDAPIAEAKSRASVTQWLLAGPLINFFAAIALVVYINQGTLRRLRVLMDNTNRLARGVTLLPRTEGGDEIGHLDKVFHEMADALAQAAEHKKELIAMVTHDLRTPLTSIQASLALMDIGACGELPPKAQAEVEAAERSATRLINLINDLLDVEKMAAGKLDMNIQPTSSRQIVERSVEAVGAFAEQQKIQFKIARDDVPVNADSDRLVQVLVNLLSNAIKFSPEGGAIEVSVTPQSGQVEFRVADQGPGIPDEFKDAVFEPFKQIEGIASTKLKGTGLGLAICRAIVKGHEGEIGFDSEVGKGTAFWFTIPAAPASLAIGKSTDTVYASNL